MIRTGSLIPSLMGWIMSIIRDDDEPLWVILVVISVVLWVAWRLMS